MYKSLHYKKTFCFCIVLLAILFYNLSFPGHQFYQDSELYWELGRKFMVSGIFSWLTYDNYLRGYLLPFISFVSISLSKFLGMDEVTFFKITSSLFFSFFFTVLIPKFYEKFTGRNVSILSILSFSAIMIYFWRGFFLYPMSDFMSMFFLIVVAYNLVCYFQKKHYIHMLSLGFFLAASTLARPSYQIVIVPIIALLIVQSFIKSGYKKYLPISLAFIFISMAVVYSPQIHINKNNFKSVSPFVQTGFGSESNLFARQLFWGLTTQRYETNRNLTVYPNAPVSFSDKMGSTILKREKITDKEYSLGKYLTIVSKYPVDSLLLYFRHLFNGLDTAWSTVYITDLYNNRIIFSLINYTLGFIACYQLIQFFKSAPLKETIKKRYFELIIVFIFLAPSIISIPTALEIRFFIPFYLLSYIIFTYHILGKKRDSGEVKLIIQKLIPHYIAFILICFMLSANTFENIPGDYILHNR